MSTTANIDPTRRPQAVAAWVLALPFVVLFLGFTAGPVLASLGMSFTDFRISDMRSPFSVNFVGFENYAALLGDELFRKVAVNTALYVVLGVPLTMALALAVAVGLNRVARLRGFFRVGYYLPVITSIVAIAVVWRFLLNPDVGLINMNAREYDPVLGRFLTPDTFIQYPASTQGYNRYTYVNNNPLSFTDPSGHFLKSISRAVKSVVNEVKRAASNRKGKG